MYDVVQYMIPFDTNLSDLLSEVVLYCSKDGSVLYANPAAHQWGAENLEGHPFVSLLQPDSVSKGHRFFETARTALPHNPTLDWELTLGSVTNYTVAMFRGYATDDHVVAVGRTESPEVIQMQQEMMELTSELAQVQRDLRRQNHSLQKLVEEQRQLMQTIQELSTPAVPIWDGVLLLPLVGHIDSQRAERMTEALLQRVHEHHAHYVILDMTGIALVDADIAQHLMDMAHALQLLGTRPVLVGVTPTTAETIVQLGIELQGFLTLNDLQQAIAYVLGKIRKRI